MRLAILHNSAVAILSIAMCASAATPVGDAGRGEKLFQSEGCIKCHSVQGRGGSIAPDLTRRLDRDFTPAVMASLMWNHAPQMWSAMQQQGIAKPSLTAEGAADLFAYFVSARYFEKPGDAGRGKIVFSAHHCADCHGITTSKFAGAPPVAKWESLRDPIMLAQQMWNHGPQMRQAFTQKGLKFAPLTAQELTDLLVYLQNLPETKDLSTNFQLPSTDGGEALFKSKGCVDCHCGAHFPAGFHNQTLTDIAVAMWNHQPLMRQPPPTFTADEMRQIIGYIWSSQYFRGSGSAARGAKVFAQKNCGACHNDPSSGAPKLARGKDAYSDITMVAALWQHGPQMLARMNDRKLPWPRFTAVQMSDLIAYLNSL